MDHMLQSSEYCGVDIFLLGPRLSPATTGIDGTVDTSKDQRWRVAIYGDMESTEHAKTRILIYIDRLVGFFSFDRGVFGMLMKSYSSAASLTLRVWI